MNKGMYGYPLPPNVPTRVAPARWVNQRLITQAGAGTFTVPQNVFQVRATVIGGGADGCNPFFDPMVSGRKFHFLPAQKYRNYGGAYHVNHSPHSSGAGPVVVSDAGKHLYCDSAAFYSNSDIRNYQGESAVGGVSLGDGAYLVKNGTTVLVVPRSSGGTSYKSTDGGVTFSSGGAIPAYSTCWDGGSASLSSSSFCGANSSNVAVYTTNAGTTWSASAALSGANIGAAYGMAAGAGLYVAVGSTSTTDRGIATSPTGATWTARASGTADTRTLNSVRFLNGQFIVVGNSGYIATSPDGITWTPRTSGTANALHDVTWDGTRYVAVGASATILYSTDAVTWAAATKSGITGSKTFRGVVSPASDVFFAYDPTATNTDWYGAASIDGGLSWYPTLWSGYTDTMTAAVLSATVVSGQVLVHTNNSSCPLYVSVPNSAYGGGGGGFASGIIDVVPGQTLSYVVGGVGGTSSVGGAISATGASGPTGGTGTVLGALREASTSTGGTGGSVSMSDTMTYMAMGGGGGGSCGWFGFNGGSSPTITFAGTNTYSGGLGGAGLGGDGGGSGITSLGGGGGGYRTAGGTGTSGGGGGGGSMQPSAFSVGGIGYSCAGGAPGASASGGNGAAPNSPLMRDIFSSLRNGIVDGAGGGGSSNGTTTAYSGGNGSGLGGGGGGTGGGFTTVTASSGGNGTPGGGGGGGGAGDAAGTFYNRSGGDGGMFAGGGGGGALAASSTSFSHSQVGWGGNGGTGAGGGGVGCAQMRMDAGYGAAVGTRLGTRPTPGAKINGAPGKGGSGLVVLEWTEGY